VGNEKPNLNDPSSSHLSESEAKRRLEDFTRLVSNWIWEVDREFKITFISDRVFEVLGLHPQELIGKSLDEIITFEFSSGEELGSLLSRPFRDRPSTAITHEGGTCHLLISGIPVFNLETGDFEGVRGTANDVTARIQTEKKLRESEQHYRSLIEFQRTGILVYRDYKIVFANASAVRIFGAASLEDLLGRTSLELTHPDYHDLIKKRRLEVEENHIVQDFMELIHFRIDGSEFFALDNAASILWENESAVLVSVSDISETKDAERAAALSESRFKQFAESAADMFWESDAEHRYSFISPLPANLPALAKDFPIGFTPWETEALKPDGVDWVEHRSVLDAQKPFRNFRYEVIDTIGNTRYLSRNGSPQFDENGEFSGYRGTIIDETEHVLAREKIATIQHQFFTAIENFSEGFALWDVDGIFVYCNSYYRLTHPGAQEHLLPGKSYKDFIKAYALSVNVKPRDNLDNWVQ
jgi:PAS domain S-box-containing protein